MQSKTRNVVFLIVGFVAAATANALAATAAEPSLLQLARQRFTNELALAEEKLFRAAANGGDAYCTTGSDGRLETADSADWKKDRVIRADCLAWLCTDPAASRMVTYRGMSVIGARIEEDLNLEWATVPFPLRTSNCVFTGSSILSYADLRALHLTATGIKDLQAEGLKVEKNVHLSARFKATGEVKLSSATIGGDLDCDDGQVLNHGTNALSANGAKIGGDVSLGGDFKADGQVLLLGATIGGDLGCLGGHFVNTNAVALNAGGVTVKGDVSLARGFRAEGAVQFISASIGGVLDCTGGRFVNANTNADALNADGAKIQGGVYLRRQFEADGKVNFMTAYLPRGFQWFDVKSPEKAILDLRLAKVGTLWDDTNSWPKQGNLFLHGFVYDGFDDHAPADAKSRIDWLRRQPSDPLLPQPYEQLAAVLRKMGHEEEAADVMIAKNKDQARHTSLFSASWWWYNIFGRMVGYGYNPWQPLLISVGFIVAGAVLFWFGRRRHLILPSEDKAYSFDAAGVLHIKESQSVFNAFIYSLEMFVPLVKLGMGDFWRPDATRRTEFQLGSKNLTVRGSFLRWYLWFHIIAGWVLTTLWVSGLTGLVKT